MGSGKRYDTTGELNKKKVGVTILIIAVIIGTIVYLKTNQPKQTPKKAQLKSVPNSYITIMQSNKWGVINSKGDLVVAPKYDAMVVIPDNTKDVFITQEDVDLAKGSFKSIAVNEKGLKIYTEYDQVLPIIYTDKNNDITYDKNSLIVVKDNKYGLINLSGKQLLECKYDDLKVLDGVTNSLISKENNLYGLVDISGNVIIENKYKEIKSLTNKYEDGYIVEDEAGKFGLITYNKKEVLPVKYQEIKNVYGNNMYIVKEDNKYNMVNDKDENVMKDVKDIVEINSNLLVYKEGDKYGVIDTEGKQIIKPEYQYLKHCFDNYYIAKKDNKFGIIDTDGNEKVEFIYRDIYYSKDGGYIQAYSENGKQDLFNNKFELKTTGIVSEINAKKGFIKVKTINGYKFYNFKLEEKTIKEVYPANTLFVKKGENSKYGFVDANGVNIVNYIYDDATEQNEYGFAAVKKDGKWGALDSAGNIAVEPQYKLENNLIVDFISKYHLAVDINAGYYTDVDE